MKVLCTFPGKYGDLLWALPALRALSRQVDRPVDLLVAASFASICPLIEAQDYIGDCWAHPGWQTQDTAPITPREPPDRGGAPVYDLVLHLGYRGWPTRPLPVYTLDTLNSQLPDGIEPLPVGTLQLQEPWITQLPSAPPSEIAIGFTDEHFELKVGIVTLLARMDRSLLVLTHDSRTRWAQERPRGGYPLERPLPWIPMAATIRNADRFLGCCSALHVLAVAVGTPVVLMEPNPMRHHPIFYPLGWEGPQVTLVTGVDGQPTFDARHVRETLERVLETSR